MANIIDIALLMENIEYSQIYSFRRNYLYRGMGHCLMRLSALQITSSEGITFIFTFYYLKMGTFEKPLFVAYLLGG